MDAKTKMDIVEAFRNKLFERRVEMPMFEEEGFLVFNKEREDLMFFHELVWKTDDRLSKEYWKLRKVFQDLFFSLSEKDRDEAQPFKDMVRGDI